MINHLSIDDHDVDAVYAGNIEDETDMDNVFKERGLKLFLNYF